MCSGGTYVDRHDRTTLIIVDAAAGFLSRGLVAVLMATLVVCAILVVFCAPIRRIHEAGRREGTELE